MKIFIFIFIFLISMPANTTIWNMSGHICIKQTAARNAFINYLNNKTSSYVLRNIEQPIGYSSEFRDTNTVAFSIRTDKKSIRDEIVLWFQDKIQQYAVYVGTGSQIYKHVCHNDDIPGTATPCINELIWEK